MTVRVNGLACDFCARLIEAVMKRREDVERMQVDLDRGEVHLVLRADASLTDPQLTELIVDAGAAGDARARRGACRPVPGWGGFRPA